MPDMLALLCIGLVAYALGLVGSTLWQLRYRRPWRDTDEKKRRNQPME
jgi:hypothetical protein